MKAKKISLLLYLSLLLSCSSAPIDDSVPDSGLISEEVTQSDEHTYTSDEDNLSREETNNINYKYFDKPVSIYLNPSVQYSNLYINNLGNEGQHMNEIAILLYDILTINTNLIVYGNLSIPGLSLSNSLSQSNSYDVDLHIAIHSNAGGGSGSEIWYGNQAGSYDLSKEILSSINGVLPYKTRGLKNGSSSLYEIKQSKASVTLIELLFHDEINQATYLIEHKFTIAYAIYGGIINYLED